MSAIVKVIYRLLSDYTALEEEEKCRLAIRASDEMLNSMCISDLLSPSRQSVSNPVDRITQTGEASQVTTPPTSMSRTFYRTGSSYNSRGLHKAKLSNFERCRMEALKSRECCLTPSLDIWSKRRRRRDDSLILISQSPSHKTKRNIQNNKHEDPYAPPESSRGGKLWTPANVACIRRDFKAYCHSLIHCRKNSCHL